METPPDKIDLGLLEEMARHKTSGCLSENQLGQYIEHTLPGQEREPAEKHLASCLYCLNQLIELRELLFLEKNAEPLSPLLENSLRRLVARDLDARIVTERLRAFAKSRTALSTLEKNAESLSIHRQMIFGQSVGRDPEARIVTERPLRAFATSFRTALSAFLKGSYGWQGATAFEDETSQQLSANRLRPSRKDSREKISYKYRIRRF